MYGSPMSDGSWVSDKVARVAELIREYDPRLDVKWIPREARHEGDAAFAITERTADGREVVAFHVQSEAEMDERVLERIYLADNTKHDVQARMEAKNKAARELARKAAQDAHEDRMEFARFLSKSPLHTIKHGDKKIIR